MSNNLHRVQNIFISDGTAFPANDAATSSVTAGKIGIYGQDMLALNPAGGDTITTQPFIYLLEGKTDSNSVNYLKRSFRIDGANVTKYEGQSYAPDQPNVWSIGYSRKTATGSIEVNNSTTYKAVIRFKNDKNLYSARPEVLTITFDSIAAATKLTIATQISNAINNSAFKGQISAIVVGNGTGVYGVTGATEYGVEIWAKDINQFIGTNYTPNNVYFSVHVDDSTGFGATTCTEIQAFNYGVGTYTQVRMIEDFDLGYEGITNKRMWPIPSFDYSSTSTLINSAVIGINTTGTSGEDQVSFAGSIAAIIRPGEKVEIDGVNYTVKYIKGNGTGTGAGNEVVLTSPLTTSPAAADVTKIRVKYDLVVIEFNDVVTYPTGGSAVAQKSVVIAVPALDSGDAYNGISAAGQDVLDVLNGWMPTTPRAFATISI